VVNIRHDPHEAIARMWMWMWQRKAKDWSGVVELFGPCLFMWRSVCSVSDSSSRLFN